MISYHDHQEAPTRRCEHPGCHDRTRFQKPYCERHLFQLPYVAAIRRELDERDHERRRVSRYGVKAANPRGMMAQEVLLLLWWSGPLRAERIAMLLSVSANVAVAYLRSLERAGLVSREVNTRRVKTGPKTGKVRCRVEVWDITGRAEPDVKDVDPEPDPGDNERTATTRTEHVKREKPIGVCPVCGIVKPLMIRGACGACYWGGVDTRKASEIVDELERSA